MEGVGVRIERRTQGVSFGENEDDTQRQAVFLCVGGGGIMNTAQMSSCFPGFL